MEKMEVQSPSRIHIIPVGNAGVDRTIKPALFLKPERVYLLTMAREDAFAGDYLEIRQRFTKYLHDPEFNLIELTVNYYDLEEFLSKIAMICTKENNNKTEIWFNISGGTMISVVGTLSSMYFGVKPYFMKFNYMEKKLEDGALLPPIPHYSIIKPDRKLIRFLILLNNELKKSSNTKFPKRLCIELIKNNQLDTDFTGSETSIYNKLNSRYLTPLEKDGYIITYKTTHSDIEITKEGYFAMHVFGDEENLS